jgi:hypothetical protein
VIRPAVRLGTDSKGLNLDSEEEKEELITNLLNYRCENLKSYKSVVEKIREEQSDEFFGVYFVQYTQNRELFHA